MSSSWSLLTFIGAALLALAPSIAAAGERTVTPREAVRLALEGNLDLRREQGEVQAARARLHGIPLLHANPDVSVHAGPRRRDGASSLDLEIGIAQPFEIAGQRGARVGAASAGLEAAEARYRARRVDVAAETREAFGRALAAGRLVQLERDAAALAERSLETARAREEAGAASALEVNSARVGVGRARREARLAETRRVAAMAALRRLLGLVVDDPVRLEGELTSTGASLAVDELLTRAREGRADLGAARSDLRAAEAEARLASRETVPALRLGVTYGQEEDAKIILGTLGFDLPLFSRNQIGRGVATVKVSQARIALEASERQVTQDVLLAAASYAGARAAAEDFAAETVAAMEENLSLVGEAYAAGKVDFLQLLLVRRETLEAQRAHVEALEVLNAARAQLARAIGSEEEF